MKEAGLGNSQLILKCQTQGENNPLIEESRVCRIHMFSQWWTTISVKIFSFIYLTSYCFIEWDEGEREEIPIFCSYISGNRLIYATIINWLQVLSGLKQHRVTPCFAAS